MKEEYLWDKTGEDAEIERLEKALRAFRFQETAPPELPQKVFTVEKEASRRFFRFGLTFAGFAAAVLILSVVWFRAANNTAAIIEPVAEKTGAPANAGKIADTANIQKPESAAVEKSENPPVAPKPEIVRIRQNSAPKTRPQKAVRRNITEKQMPDETLTAEEKYAYDQLMLALSITGSKLRIVKDKINGIEEQNAVLERKK